MKFKKVKIFLKDNAEKFISIGFLTFSIYLTLIIFGVSEELIKPIFILALFFGFLGILGQAITYKYLFESVDISKIKFQIILYYIIGICLFIYVFFFLNLFSSLSHYLSFIFL